MAKSQTLNQDTSCPCRHCGSSVVQLGRHFLGHEQTLNDVGQVVRPVACVVVPLVFAHRGAVVVGARSVPQQLVDAHHEGRPGRQVVGRDVRHVDPDVPAEVAIDDAEAPVLSLDLF